MKVSLYIAKRYLFSKKSHNAINFISMVAMCGIAIATMATVCAMSVFDGFKVLVSDMFNAFDPELKITPVKGKVFDPTTADFQALYNLPEIALITETVEDNVLIKNGDKYVPAVLKGVSDNFTQLTHIEDIMFSGDFHLQDEVNDYTVMGIGLASTLGAYADQRYPLEIYAPRRNVPVDMINPSGSFRQDYVYISSTFLVNQPVYDENYLLVPLSLARELFDYPTAVSSLELKLAKGVTIKSAQKKISEIIGSDYEVKDRYEQQEAVYKMMNIEKWVVFFILCFIVLVAAFNVIGSLSMLIMEKKDDIATLRNLGADNKLISRIFLFEGWLITAIGAIAGIVLGVLVCWGQQHFGWLKLGTINAYPVHIEAGDLLVIFVSVLVIGLLAVLYPVHYLAKKWLK